MYHIHSISQTRAKLKISGILQFGINSSISITTRKQPMLTLLSWETHNGAGLSNKSSSQRQEYVSVRDHRLEGPFTVQSSHGVLRTEFLEDRIFIIDPVSTVHLTYHHSRSYSLPVVHQGHLTKQGTNRLIKLYNDFAPDGPPL